MSDDQADAWLEGTPDGGVIVHDVAIEWLEKKYRSMSLARRRRFVKKGLGKLEMMDGILWVMCRDNLDAQGAAELMIDNLKSGKWVMEAVRG